MRFHRRWFALLLVLAVAASVSAQTASVPGRGAFSDILSDLQEVEDEMTANQEKIEALKGEIAHLQSLGKNAEQEISDLQALVAAHAARVEQLGERYSTVLALAQKLKKELEFSSTINVFLGTGAAVAVVVAVVEGLILLGK